MGLGLETFPHARESGGHNLFFFRETTTIQSVNGEREEHFNKVITRSNTRGIPFILAVGVVFAWSFAVAAQDIGSGADGNGDAGRFYASGDAGVAILQNIIAEGSVQQFNVGPRVDVSVGYNITQNVAVEIQGGFAHNDLYKVNGQPAGPQYSIDMWTVPVMANGIYKYSFNHHWQAYGGLGAGGVMTRIGVTSTTIESVAVNPDCEFGYQAILGIKYRFNDHFECRLGYTFLGSLDQHYSETITEHLPFPFPPSIQTKVSVSTSPIYMHSILLSLTYKF